MEIQGLVEQGVPEWAVERLADKGITELNPPQAAAVEAGLLDGESLLVSSPTASGKTLIATLAISKLVEQGGGKAVYLVPLKALGSEKYRDYTEFFQDEADVALSIGDRDSAAGYVETKDLIIMTVEKLDAVLRHNPAWVKDVDLVVTDEIHLLDAEGRGPTLEVTLTRLRELMEFQLLGLSATVKNSGEMADWLDAGLVESDYRPVDLQEGIYHDGRITFYPEGAVLPDGSESSPGTNSDGGDAFVTGVEKLEQEEVEEEVRAQGEQVDIATGYGKATLNILDDTVRQGAQAITFVRSRKSAEAAAEKAGRAVTERLSRDEQEGLDELADRVETVLGSPTTQCRRLADCVRDGAAFHHAGLLSEQRGLIEDAFRDDLLKSIAATPTLAAGMSLPAYRIIVRDVKRYTDNGLQYIPVLEYKQMAGRAGRPEHHDRGEAIVVAKQPGDADELRDRYVLGEVERIHSKLAVEPVLRMHALGLIATRFVTDMDELHDFFAATFYAHQFGDMAEVESKLADVVESLHDYGFVDAEGGELAPTRIGRRVAELYVDPFTAHELIQHMERMRGEEDVEPVATLVALAETVEMKPRLRVRQSERADVEDMLAHAEDALLGDVPKPWDDWEYERFLRSLKTGMMLKEWIAEVEEDDLMERYTVTPGGVRAKVESADWLLYACTELAGLKGWNEVKKEMQHLRTRVKHGIREELLSLVRFDQVGRVRARALHDRGITTASDIRETSFNALKNAVGKRTAESLKEQVGQDDIFDKENILDYFGQDEE